MKTISLLLIVVIIWPNKVKVVFAIIIVVWVDNSDVKAYGMENRNEKA